MSTTQTLIVSATHNQAFVPWGERTQPENMTQIQRILAHLQDINPKHAAFPELYDHLEDVPKGSLSALLATMYRDGLVERQLRIVQKGRDLQEYRITDEGGKYLEQAAETDSKRVPRAKSAKRAKVQPSADAPTAIHMQASTMVQDDVSATFGEVGKFASKQTEYAQLQNFVRWLMDKHGVEVFNKSIKQDMSKVNDLTLEYLGVDPEGFQEQRGHLEALLGISRGQPTS